ncbi:hypothetical protein OH77DRAFT_843078 [Trametes cingulata]|nr:hypothetical protein OH77DRAFT_843078 [Trametes cingulata]
MLDVWCGMLRSCNMLMLRSDPGLGILNGCLSSGDDREKPLFTDFLPCVALNWSVYVRELYAPPVWLLFPLVPCKLRGKDSLTTQYSTCHGQDPRWDSTTQVQLDGGCKPRLSPQPILSMWTHAALPLTMKSNVGASSFSRQPTTLHPRRWSQWSERCHPARHYADWPYIRAHLVSSRRVKIRVVSVR